MSKETEPIRSRRQLREQSAHTTGAPGASAAPAGIAPVSPVPAAPKAAPPAPTPQTSEAAPQRERDSQIRARDRAALRAYKGLIDPPELSPLPSRKALRQAQLEAERAPITAVNPVVSVTATGKKSPVAPQTLQGPAVAPGTIEIANPQAAGTAGPATDAQATPSVSETVSAPKSAPVSVPATPAEPLAASAPASAPAPAQGMRSGGGRRAAAVAADKFGGGTARVAAAGTAASPVAPGDLPGAVPGVEEAAVAAVVPAAARQLPSPPATKPGNAPAEALQEATSTQDVAAEGESESSVSSSAVTASDPSLVSTHELVPGGSYYPISAGPPVAPGPEELAALAAKRAEAERAAILAQRAQTRERLAQENVKNRRPTADPTATNNLAMVTPMEFIEVPGSERPMMRPPTTTHVPIVTRSTPRQSPATPSRPATLKASANTGVNGTSEDTRASITDAVVAENKTGAQNVGASATATPNINAERFDAAVAARAVQRPGPGKRPLTGGGRSSTLKRAEAMAAVDHAGPAIRPAVPPVREVAEPVPVQRSQMPPIPADYAHGMEPLDAMTAGLRRTQRNLLIQWGSIILGGAAFVAGAIMVLTNILN